jgi:hypothetical protein
VDGSRVVKHDLMFWRFGRVQSSSVRPTNAVGIGLRALMESANRVPICLPGYDASDCRWVVPVPGLTGFAITSHRPNNLLKLYLSLALFYAASMGVWQRS